MVAALMNQVCGWSLTTLYFAEWPVERAGSRMLHSMLSSVV